MASQAHTTRRSFLASAAAVPALAVPAIVVATELPKGDPRQLVDSYNAFLHLERRQLLWELANAHSTDWKQLMKWVPMDNAGSAFHCDPPTTAVERASLVLRSIGCDWTS